MTTTKVLGKIPKALSHIHIQHGYLGTGAVRDRGGADVVYNLDSHWLRDRAIVMFDRIDAQQTCK